MPFFAYCTRGKYLCSRILDDQFTSPCPRSLSPSLHFVTYSLSLMNSLENYLKLYSSLQFLKSTNFKRTLYYIRNFIRIIDAELKKHHIVWFQTTSQPRHNFTHLVRPTPTAAMPNERQLDAADWGYKSRSVAFADLEWFTLIHHHMSRAVANASQNTRCDLWTTKRILLSHTTWWRLS